MTEVIFLDIDGVLRTFKSDLEWSSKLEVPVFKGKERLFSPVAVNNLNYISSLTRAKIVITSTWRLHHTLPELRAAFRKRGVFAEIIGFTPTLGTGRGEEILQWLQDNDDVTNYVVVDDQIKDIIPVIDSYRIFKIDPQVGLDNQISDMILDVLG